MGPGCECEYPFASKASRDGVSSRPLDPVPVMTGGIGREQLRELHSKLFSRGCERQPRGPAQPSGMRVLLCASHWENDWSSGLSERATLRSREPVKSSAKSR